MVVGGWAREGQGQGLLLVPGKTLLAGANGFQTRGPGAASPGLPCCRPVWPWPGPWRGGALGPES